MSAFGFDCEICYFAFVRMYFFSILHHEKTISLMKKNLFRRICDICFVLLSTLCTVFLWLSCYALKWLLLFLFNFAFCGLLLYFCNRCIFGWFCPLDLRIYTLVGSFQVIFSGIFLYCQNDMLHIYFFGDMFLATIVIILSLPISCTCSIGYSEEEEEKRLHV